VGGVLLKEAREGVVVVVVVKEVLRWDADVRKKGSFRRADVRRSCGAATMDLEASMVEVQVYIATTATMIANKLRMFR